MINARFLQAPGHAQGGLHAPRKDLLQNALGAEKEPVFGRLNDAKMKRRIELLEVDADIDPGHAERIVISIRYRLRSEASEQSLVFPFYRLPAADQELG